MHLLLSALRAAYGLARWRLTDEAFCRLGERFSSLQHCPVKMRDGRKLYLDLRNPVSIPYVLEGNFPAEKIETMLIGELVRPGERVVDIGANVGWYSSLLCHCVGGTGVVHAFEPNPYLAPLLESLALDYPQLVLHKAALGACATETEFYIPTNWISGSCMPTEENSTKCRVRMARLERELSEQPHFIKLDAEGAEMDVLQGSEHILNSGNSPIWMVELSTQEARNFGHDVGELVDLFKRANRARYTAYLINHSAPYLIPLALPSSGEFWFNALFVPEHYREKVPEHLFVAGQS